MIRIFLNRIALISFISFTAVSDANPTQFQHFEDSARVPDSWFILPEGATGIESATPHSFYQTQNLGEKLAPTVQRIFKANEKAINMIEKAAPRTPSKGSKFEPEIPWHLAFFTTDLALTQQGLLGALTVTGQPSIEVFWGKKSKLYHIEKELHQESAPASPKAHSPTISLTDHVTPAEIQRHLEPIIKAAIAKGKVKDGPVLRQNLQETATELHALVQAIEISEDRSMWASKFRFDFILDFSGNIFPAVNAGAELSFRLEWQRLKRKSGPSPRSNPSSRPGSLFTFRQGLQELVSTMETVLEEVKDEAPPNPNFETYVFRIGVGLSAKGNVGLVKGVTQGIGYVYFSNRVIPPSLDPSASFRQQPHRSSLDQIPIEFTGTRPLKKGPSTPQISQLSKPPILMIHQNPPSKHIEYAKKVGIPFDHFQHPHIASAREIVYQISQEKLKKGLHKAIAIGSFFTQQTPKANSTWRVYQIRTGFQLSLTGSVGLVAIGGSAALQLAFFNKRF